jgi:hypothetical protein
MEMYWLVASGDYAEVWLDSETNRRRSICSTLRKRWVITHVRNDRRLSPDIGMVHNPEVYAIQVSFRLKRKPCYKLKTFGWPKNLYFNSILKEWTTILMNTRSVDQGSCFKDIPHRVDYIGSNSTLFPMVLTIASISKKMNDACCE